MSPKARQRQINERLRFINNRLRSETGDDRKDLYEEKEKLETELNDLPITSRSYEIMQDMLNLANSKHMVHAASDSEDANHFFKLVLDCIAGYYFRKLSTDVILKGFEDDMRKSSAYAKKLGVKFKPFDNFRAKLTSVKNRTERKNLDILGDALDEVVEEIARIKKKVLADNSLSTRQLDLFNRVNRFLNNDTEENEKAIEPHVGFLGNDRINSWFSPKFDKGEYKKNLEEMRHLVKKLGGDSHTLTKEQTDAIPKNRQNQLDRYKALRKSASESYKGVLRDILRKSGKSLLDVEVVKNALQSYGIAYHPIPDGFKGKIDEKGALYTSDGDILDNPPTAGSRVEMNPKYGNGEITYCKYWPPYAKKDAGPQYARTRKQVQNTTGEMDTKVQFMKQHLPATRKRWITDLKSNNEEAWALGLMAILMDTYTMRIGSPGNKTDDAETHGLSTLLIKQVKTVGTGLKLAYTGKSGVDQAHVIKPNSPISKLVIERLKEIMIDGKPSDYVFVVDQRRITSNEFNRYLTKTGLSGITAKMFRRYKGMEIMENYLESKPLKKNANQKEAEDYLKNGALQVGMQLGHRRGDSDFTPATALKSYIPPGIMLKFFEDRGLHVPKWLQRHQSD